MDHYKSLLFIFLCIIHILLGHSQTLLNIFRTMQEEGSIYSNHLKTIIYGPLQVIAIYIYIHILFKNYSNTLKQYRTLWNIFRTTQEGGRVYM